MNGICVACGKRTRVQLHHPGQRTNTEIVVPVCVPDHVILTIWDGGKSGERNWIPGISERIRVRVGMFDVVRLASLRTGLSDDEIWDLVNDYRPMFRFVPSATQTAYKISRITPDDRVTQMKLLRKMVEAL